MVVTLDVASAATTAIGSTAPNLAIQANTGILWTVGDDGVGQSTGLGMAADTSPSVAALFAGGYATAFQANTGALWTVGPDGVGRAVPGALVAPGTSPAVAPAPATGSSWVIAYQDPQSGLDAAVVTSTGPTRIIHSPLSIKPGTSPSVTATLGTTGDPGGTRVVVAFQDANGDLTTATIDPDSFVGVQNLHLGLAPGTSPSVTAVPDTTKFVIAFQANTGILWTVNSNGVGHATGLGMATHTSPAIEGFLNGLFPGAEFNVAFQANTGILWTVDGNGAGHSTGLGMAPETSPSIALDPAGDGALVYFQANTTALWTLDRNRVGHATSLAMAPRTSPASDFPDISL